MPTKAPYRHSDGSNCWTKNCSRGHRKQTSNVPATYNDFVAQKLQELQAHKPSQPAKVSFQETQPLHVISGSRLNKTLVTTLSKPLNMDEINPVHDTDHDLEKPDGGLWLTTVNDDGTDGWSRSYTNSTYRYQVNLAPGATVAVIDSAEDYVALMQRFKHTEYSFNQTGKNNNTYYSTAGGSVWNKNQERLDSLDYGKLSEVVDALYVTDKGIAECGVWSSADDTNKLPKNMATLSAWDIPTVLVFKPTAIASTQTSKAPEVEQDELDKWFDEEYAGLWDD